MVQLQTTVAYTVKEVAEMLGLDPVTVRSYIRAGKLRAQKVGRSYYITAKTLEEFLTGEKVK